MNVSTLPRATPLRGPTRAAVATGLIRAGGVLSFLFALLHLSYWSAPGWTDSLAVLPDGGAGIVQALNASVAATMLVFAFVSLFHARELHEPGLGRALSLAIAFFWVARTAEEVLFFGFSLSGVLIFLAVGALYAVPAAMPTHPAAVDTRTGP